MPRLPKLPIEVHIAETGGDRRAVYERNMRQKGNKRVGFWVPQTVAEEVRDLCARLVHCDDPAKFRDALKALAASVSDDCK